MNPGVAMLVLHFRKMDCLVLAAARLQLQGHNHIPKENLAYEPFLEVRVIQEDGSVNGTEEVLDALSIEIERRMDEGTWE